MFLTLSVELLFISPPKKLFKLLVLFNVQEIATLGCLNSNAGPIWTNPNVGLNMQLKIYS